MLAGLSAALGAGLLWGLVFIVPLLLPDYSGAMLAAGRYAAFGVLAIVLARADGAALKRLTRADWIAAAKLALIGNMLYFAALASAIQLASMMFSDEPTVLHLACPSLDSISTRTTEPVPAPWSPGR